MATAEELLTIAANAEAEPHIVIDTYRNVNVPAELRTIAVQYDHNIETVTFDAPRYWDGHDLSKMMVFVNYMRPDNQVGQYHCGDVTIDSDDSSIMHFTWTISGHVTEVSGTISFLVVVKTSDINGNLKNRWSSVLNQDMIIKEGMEVSSKIADAHPDVITAILLRLDMLESIHVNWEQNDPNSVDYIHNRPMYLDSYSLAWDGDFDDGVNDLGKLSDVVPNPEDFVGGTVVMTCMGQTYTCPIIANCLTSKEAEEVENSQTTCEFAYVYSEDDGHPMICAGNLEWQITGTGIKTLPMVAYVINTGDDAGVYGGLSVEDDWYLYNKTPFDALIDANSTYKYAIITQRKSDGAYIFTRCTDTHTMDSADNLACSSVHDEEVYIYNAHGKDSNGNWVAGSWTLEGTYTDVTSPISLAYYDLIWTNHTIYKYDSTIPYMEASEPVKTYTHMLELNWSVPRVDPRYKKLFTSNVYVLSTATSDGSDIDFSVYSPGDVVLIVPS